MLKLALESELKRIKIWLSIICLMIAAIVIIGGITRLTVSGLSITEWRPITGVIPPLNIEQWQLEFQKYQTTPQFQHLNQNMTLDEFKFIFFWEYLHRLIARSLGLVFLLPLLYFSKRKQISKTLKQRLWVGFALGGLQGLIGWLMVKSGLTERTFVSHYRLGIHLVLAFFIFSYLLWLILTMQDLNSAAPAQKYTGNKSSFFARKSSALLVVLLFVQIFWGALVAGLHSGHFYNDYPLMNGQFFPATQLSLEPYIINFLDSTAGTQFFHRWLAPILILIFLFLAYYLFPKAWKQQTRLKDTLVVSNWNRWIISRRAVLWGFSFQFLLGVLTLLNAVPLVLGVLHQIGAFLLLGLLIWFHFESIQLKNNS